MDVFEMMKGPLFWVAWIGTAVFGIRALDYVMHSEWREDPAVERKRRQLDDNELEISRLQVEAQKLSVALLAIEVELAVKKKQ